MERLTGLDAGFLYMETPSQHLHTLKIAVLDPSTIPGGYRFERVKEVLAERIHLLPPFRRRLVTIPFGLHHPVWIEDPEFDLDRHVRRTAVPAPGGQAELDEVISEIASHPLDRSRPLWEVWVVEGLEHGHVGFVAKIHHCAADGVKAAELLTNVFDLEADAPAPLSDDTWRPEPVPSRRDLVVGALVDLLRELASLPSLVRRTLGGFVAVARRRRTGALAPPLPFSAPKLAFNRALTPRRIFSSTSLSLDEVKEVKTAFDVTVNDVVLAVCAGALRRWLEARRELPDRPLVAGVPVSTRTQEKGLLANSVSNLFTSIPVQLDDPVARLRAVHEVMKGAKEQHNLLGAEMLADWSELTPPKPFTAVVHLYSRLHLADRHRPPINLVISNVPGPTQPLFVGGARLVGIWSMGPILENIGLNVTVWSYLGQMNVGLVACRDAVPDLPRLTGYLHEALGELRKVAEGNHRATPAV
jgi:diacylglycerol O-acyltransferase